MTDILSEAAAVVAGAENGAIIERLAAMVAARPGGRFMFMIADSDAVGIELCSNATAEQALWMMNIIALDIAASLGGKGAVSD